MDEQQYPRCMLKTGDETYKCSLNKFGEIHVPDSQLPIICNICPLAKELSYSIDVVKSGEYPSATEMIKNFAGSMANYIKSGLQHVSKEDYTNRIDICKDCEYYDNGRCTVCGCFLFAKARMKSENCPKNKWPKLDNEDGDNSA